MESKTKLFDMFHRKIRKKDLDEALKYLKVNGMIKEAIVQDRGKPKAIYSTIRA